jgi:hypothetical protein
MLLDASTWVYSALSTDAAVIAALTGGAGVVLIFPNDFETLPVLTYSVSQSVSMMDVWDDQPNANDVVATLDIYTRNDALTRDIEVAVDAVMVGLLFNLDYREALGDPSMKTQHVSLRYSRQGVLAEDVA